MTLIHGLLKRMSWTNISTLKWVSNGNPILRSTPDVRNDPVPTGSYSCHQKGAHNKYGFNSSPPVQNGRHFADDAFKCIFVKEKVCILIFQTSLKIVSKGPIDNIPALVYIMAWRRIGDKPLSEPILNPIHRRIYAALEGDELKPFIKCVDICYPLNDIM